MRSLISLAFAGLALLLACFGIYGVLSYAVASRSRELGVRIALGASRADIAGIVMGEGLRLSLMGVALGAGASFALTRFMESLLFQVKPGDPGLLSLVALLLIGTTLLACWAPTRRALRTDPATTLRNQ